MNLCVLTTETPHHAYFVKSLREKFPGTRVFCETGISRQPASRLCVFEKQREEWEWAKWFKGEKTPISVLAPTENFPTLNSSEAIGCLRAARPDIILVFGTGILQEPILQIRPRGTFNLHGGNPEEYRGLDTHLWAIFERKFNDLITTLHHVDTGIDTGDIVERVRLPLKKNMELFELRAVNTEVCLEMTLRALRKLMTDDTLPAFPQTKRGRYFSAMPPETKNQCPIIFRQYTGSLLK